MFPPHRHRRARRAPFCLPIKQQVDVPSIRTHVDRFSIGLERAVGAANYALGIPVMAGARIWHQVRSALHVPRGTAHLIGPDDEDGNVIARLLIEPFFLQRGDPSQTDPSSRRGEQDRPNFSFRRIECCPQWLGVGVKHLVGGFRLARTARGQSQQGRHPEAFHRQTPFTRP